MRYPTKLGRQIVLKSRSTARDSYGGQSEAWTTVATVWAGIRPLTSRERMAAAAVQSDVSHQITIRYQPQFADPKVLAAMRAEETKDGITRIFNIQGGWDIDEGRRFILLEAVEGLNDG
jgi:SPP1 family predicted phage head-tail adaptor